MSTKGRSIARIRGYEVFHWTGPLVDEGKMKPYSFRRPGGSGGKEFDTEADARAGAAQAPPLKLIKVEFEMYLDVEATDEEIQEWLEFELGYNGSISGTNPLCKKGGGLDATDVFLMDSEIQK